MRIGRRTFSATAVGWTLVGAIAAGIAAVAVAASLGASIYGMPVAIAFVLALLHGAAIPVALLKPVPAAVVAALLPAALTLASAGGAEHAPWPWAVTTIVTQALIVLAIGVQARARVGFAAWLLGVAGTIAVWVAIPREPDASAVNIIVAASVVVGAYVAGMVLREWRSIQAQLIRAREDSAQEHEHRLLAEQKTRIARELHDVVAHTMSLISVRASTAAYRHPDVPAVVAQELDEIAAEARAALVELRRLLGVLREDDAARELAPQAGLADIPELIATAERSGIAVDFRWSVERTDDVGDLVSLSAYRIVQEAMSNAARHAPGAPISVACTRTDAAIDLEIVNAAPARPAAAGDPGHGIIGMRERAAAVGGTLDLGPTGDGGFRVHATLPLHARAEVDA